MNQRFITRLLLACGVIGSLLFIIVFLIEGATRPGYSAWRHAVSQLSLGDQGWMNSINIFVCGLFLLCFRAKTGAAIGESFFLGTEFDPALRRALHHCSHLPGQPDFRLSPRCSAYLQSAWIDSCSRRHHLLRLSDCPLLCAGTALCGRCRLDGLGTLLPYHKCGSGSVLYCDFRGHDARYERTPAKCAGRPAPARRDHQRLWLDHASCAPTSAPGEAGESFTLRKP